MRPRGTYKVWFTLLVIACGALFAHRWLALVAAKQQAELDRGRLESAMSAAAEIQALSRVPASAISPEAKDHEILRDIQTVLTASGLPSSAARELLLHPASADAGRGLITRTGRIALEPLPLEAIGRFLAAWSERLTALRVERLQLEVAAAKDDRAEYRMAMSFSALSAAATSNGATGGAP